MKKMMIMMMVVFACNDCNAFQDLQATQSEATQAPKIVFLDANDIEEYIEYQGDLQNVNEYDQNVTDNVTVPKISPAEAMLKEILSSLLIHYLSLRETAYVYLQEIKDILTQWYNNMIRVKK